MNNIKAHASSLTTLWIAMSFVLFPAFIFLGRGSLDSGDQTTATGFIASVSFYIYLFIESIIASARLKYIQGLKKYIIAVLTIVFAPILLIVGIIANEYSGTNAPFLLSFGIMIAVQLAASIIIWKLILIKKTTLL